MSTISSKSIPTLIDKYIKNFKEFESYMKHCVNILRNLNLLIENQFNPEVSDYDYFHVILQNISMDRFFLLHLYNHYDHDWVKKIPENAKKSIKTNIYCRDDMAVIATVIYDLKGIQDQFRLSNHQEGIHPHSTLPLCKMSYIVIENGYAIDLDKEYTFNEIYHLIVEKKILVVDSYTEAFDIDQEQFIEGINAKKLIFINSRPSPILGNNYKAVDSFYDMQGEEEQKLWYVTNMLFCRYVRYNGLDFINDENPDRIHCYKNFYGTVSHILEIINKLKKHYKGKRKPVPKKYEDFIKSILNSVEEEKMRYERNLSQVPINDGIPRNRKKLIESFH